MYQVGGILYNTLNISKKKERFAIILEPLQALLQLALLSFTPIDTKLNIYNNILYIQTPNWNQSILRSYYNDSKNDLFFLFNIFLRFNKFYQHLKNISDEETNLFTLIKKLCNKGIDNLLQTYKQTDNPALLHTLNIYKNMLNTADKNNNVERNRERRNERNSEMTSDGESDSTCNDTDYNNDDNTNVVEFSENMSNLRMNEPDASAIDIDKIFINITKLYSRHDLLIIFNTLQLIIKNPQNYIDYMEGLNKILNPINKQIQKWIVDNIVY